MGSWECNGDGDGDGDGSSAPMEGPSEAQRIYVESGPSGSRRLTTGQLGESECPGRSVVHTFNMPNAAAALVVT